MTRFETTDNGHLRHTFGNGQTLEIHYLPARGMAGEPITNVQLILNGIEVQFNDVRGAIPSNLVNELQELFNDIADENQQAAINWTI